MTIFDEGDAKREKRKCLESRNRNSPNSLQKAEGSPSS